MPHAVEVRAPLVVGVNLVPACLGDVGVLHHRVLGNTPSNGKLGYKPDRYDGSRKPRAVENWVKALDDYFELNPSQAATERMVILTAATYLAEPAKGDYNAYIAKMPTEWKGYNDLAAVQISMGKHADAMTNLEKANSISPENSTIMANMGAAYGLAITLAMLSTTVLVTHYLVLHRLNKSFVWFYLVGYLFLEQKEASCCRI